MKRPRSSQGHVGHDAVRDGPQSVYEMLTWPTQVFTDAIRDEEARARLAANMSHGLLLGSDYAGARMADDALHRVSAEIASILKLGQGHGQCCVRTAYTCDCDAGPMMVCLDGSHPADHHFQFLEERLPKALLQEVNWLLPTNLWPGCSCGVRIRLAGSRATAFGTSAAHALPLSLLRTTG